MAEPKSEDAPEIPGRWSQRKRDIGTVICPEAEAKLFVTASAEVRAMRRFEELTAKGLTNGVAHEALARIRGATTSPVLGDVLRAVKALGVPDGSVEFSVRRTSQKSEIGIEDAADEIAARVASSR